MTNQDAIYILSGLRKSLHEYCGLNDNAHKAFDMAISALEKQIAKKPEQSKTPRYGMGYEYYDWCCPTCGRFLAFESSKGDHHCTCGQKIDWEEE